METKKRMYLADVKCVYLKPDFSQFNPETGKVAVNEITANFPLDSDVNAITKEFLAEYLCVQPVQIREFTAEKKAYIFDYSKMAKGLPCLISIEKVNERAKTE